MTERFFVHFSLFAQEDTTSPIGGGKYSAFYSQIIGVLHRLVMGILYQSRVAAEWICHDDRFFPFLLHTITSGFTVTTGSKNMIAFFRQTW